MKIKVKFFASLRDRIGRAEESLDIEGSSVTVADVWSKVAEEPIPDGVLIAVNMEYTDGSHSLSEGDEVAFFPPVTGG